MPMPAYDSLLQTTAVVTTVLQYLSGAVVCRKYVQKKSTGDSSGFPFMCGFLASSFWLRYGMMTDDQTLMLVNSIGATLFLCYTLVYYVFTVNKHSYVKQFGLILCVLLAVVWYTNSIEDNLRAVRIMGLTCCVVAVCFYAAPLTMLFHVIRVKNSENLPFPLIAMSFLVSLQWLIYGIMISDTFIQIPNFLGCMLSLMQLCLFVCYPPKSFANQGYKLVVDQSTIF